MNYLTINVINLVLILYTLIGKCENFSVKNLNLPETHLSQYFNHFPGAREDCLKDDSCQYSEFLNSDKYDKKDCWGYEQYCRRKDVRITRCPGNHTGYVTTKEAQLDVFHSQADFGFVEQQIKELTVMCDPVLVTDSSLECSKNLRFCRGRNIMMNFTDLKDEPMRYSMEVLKQGQIGAYCQFHKDRLDEEMNHISPLQSWAPELRYFEKLPKRPIPSKMCDLVVEKPTILMKIDASINMYHHFCDFFNLYLSQHVNLSHPNAFDRDNHILIWESYPYDSPFRATFDVFTKNKLWDLNTFRGKTVCFKNLMLPLLPRMIFGLYYNTPLIFGCENSKMFHAFSEHVLHRLGIPEEKDTKIRITFLSRKSKYRQVKNEEELLKKLKRNKKYIVQKASFERGMSFKEQLEITRNTDILIGIHGAGLTHLLFLPKWATLFELYNCEDPNCYKDLSRLRGINYITWEDQSKLDQEDEGHHPDIEGGKHPKFTNYGFDVKEFARLVSKAAEHVKNHEDFKKYLEEQKEKIVKDEL